MIKTIIALIAVLLAGWSYYTMFTSDIKVHKLDKIAKSIKSTAMEDKKLNSLQNQPIQTATVESAAQDTAAKDKEIEDKIRALKDKAGNIAAFNVSPLYKKNCSSCHGNVGQGIIGPKLMGQSADVVLKDLQDFKNGNRKNYVMYGLLGNMTDEQLVELSKEIGTFQSKLDESRK